MKDRSATKVEAWIALLRAQRIALRTVEHALKAAGFPPLEWYDVLWELERTGPLRPRDLQRRLLLAQYNLSRLLDRLEAADLVARTPCPDDARSQLLEVTSQGRSMRSSMWLVYSRAIEQAIGEELSDREAAQLVDLLRKIGPA